MPASDFPRQNTLLHVRRALVTCMRCAPPRSSAPAERARNDKEDTRAPASGQTCAGQWFLCDHALLPRAHYGSGGKSLEALLHLERLARSRTRPPLVQRSWPWPPPPHRRKSAHRQPPPQPPPTRQPQAMKTQPQPRRRWRHGELPAGAAVQQTAGGASVLRFAETTRHHAGHYSCSADNGFGPEPSNQEVKLTVHHAPAVEPLPAAVYTGLGRREEVVCVVHSSPRAEVTWTKDGQPLDSTVETSQEGPRHTLALQLTERAMFGQYSCHAHNQLGSVHSSVTITD